ncbi:MAG: flavin reductase family protein [Clostridiales bacterium]|nr:flavin reductase family protein [Clostridiales bacterium]
MKKDLRNAASLYPTPLMVIGAMVDGKPTWTLAAHMGIPSHDMIMVSLVQRHYINRGIHKNKTLSVNIVDESWLSKAEYCGCVSGNKTDKSEVFAYSTGKTGAPMIDEAKLTMECTVEDVYNEGVFENFMLRIVHTFADESILNENGTKPDFGKFKPVLFEMPGYTYLKTGETIGKCMSFAKLAE